mgnify:FL=1|tara:strand:+ start:18 stop:1070 length:1053 start_codon:yes stop_codon:yes gene_type:complete
MQHIEEHIYSWYALSKGFLNLSSPTFENLVFRFVEGACSLSKNAKLVDFERALDKFRVQYLNEFLFRTIATPETVLFMDKFKEFSEKKKKQKKDFVEIFHILNSFYKTSVGGTYIGIPLLCSFEKDIKNAPAYYNRWFYDQVMQKRKEFNIDSNKCVVCGGKSTKEIIIGRMFCPAECVPSCNKCVVEKTDVLKSYLASTEAYCIPKAPAGLVKHLGDFFKVLISFSSSDLDNLKDIRLSLDEHGARVLHENKLLKSKNIEQAKEISNLETFQGRMLEENRDSQLAIDRMNDVQEKTSRQFLSCEKAYYEIRAKFQVNYRVLDDLRRRYQDSIREQWRYYNILKERGIVL